MSKELPEYIEFDSLKKSILVVVGIASCVYTFLATSSPESRGGAFHIAFILALCYYIFGIFFAYFAAYPLMKLIHKNKLNVYVYFPVAALIIAGLAFYFSMTTYFMLPLMMFLLAVGSILTCTVHLILHRFENIVSKDKLLLIIVFIQVGIFIDDYFTYGG